MTFDLSAFALDVLPYQYQKWIIAYSGGLDSHVLLQACVAIQQVHPHIELQAVHVNHQINQQADQWVAHCQAICDEYHVGLAVETVTLDLQPGESLEAKARTCRYRALSKYIDQQSVLFTAHHLDDQAETFLLQALRGSGPRGLSAMPTEKPFGQSLQVRPLLAVSRDDLVQYATSNRLSWIEDESNLNEAFDRNFLRHQVLPLLKARFKAVTSNFARSASIAAEHESVLNDFIADLFDQIATDDPLKIQLLPLVQFTVEKQRLLLRFWLDKNNCLMPSQKQLNQIQQDVLQARCDAVPCFQLGSRMIRRYRDHLYLVPQLEVIDQATELAIEEWVANYPGALNDDDLKAFKGCVVRHRRGGERIQLQNKQQTHSLKNYFQEQGIPPWERDRLWLVMDGMCCVRIISPCEMDGL